MKEFVGDFPPVKPWTRDQVDRRIAESTCVNELRWLFKQAEAIQREGRVKAFMEIHGYLLEGFDIRLRRVYMDLPALSIRVTRGEYSEQHVIDLPRTLINDDLGLISNVITCCCERIKRVSVQTQ